MSCSRTAKRHTFVLLCASSYSKISDLTPTKIDSTREFELDEETNDDITENEAEDNQQSSESDDLMIDNDEEKKEENMTSSKTKLFSITNLDKIHPRLKILDRKLKLMIIDDTDINDRHASSQLTEILSIK